MRLSTRGASERSPSRMKLAIQGQVRRGDLGAGVSISGGVLFSNGTDVSNQGGAFDAVGGSSGYYLAGWGASAASGTSADGQPISTVIVSVGAGGGSSSAYTGESDADGNPPAAIPRYGPIAF